MLYLNGSFFFLSFFFPFFAPGVVFCFFISHTKRDGSRLTERRRFLSSMFERKTEKRTFWLWDFCFNNDWRILYEFDELEVNNFGLARDLRKSLESRWEIWDKFWWVLKFEFLVCFKSWYCWPLMGKFLILDEVEGIFMGLKSWLKYLLIFLWVKILRFKGGYI